MARVSILSPPLAVAYGAIVGRPTSDISEQMLMILPAPRAIMPRATCWPTRNGAVRLVSSTSRQTAVSNCSSGARRWMPALFTRTSIGPTSRSMRAMADATAEPSVTSNA